MAINNIPGQVNTNQIIILGGALQKTESKESKVIDNFHLQQKDNATDVSFAIIIFIILWILHFVYKERK